MTLKKSLFAALVAVSAIAMTANTSSAHLFGRGSHGSWGGSSGSWGGSSGGSWGGSSGGWGGSCGGSWGGYYGGSYGSGGSWGGGYSSCGSCGGYTVISSSCGSCGGYSSYSSGCDSCGGYSSVGYSDGGYARVSGQSTVVASSTPAVKTRLTLHVPADAKVTLAGVETKQTGEVRQFATSRLASGQAWDDYKVVIETNRDGKTLREERTIKLIGGQDEELAVNFTNDSNDQVAQLNR